MPSSGSGTGSRLKVKTHQAVLPYGLYVFLDVYYMQTKDCYFQNCCCGNALSLCERSGMLS